MALSVEEDELIRRAIASDRVDVWTTFVAKVKAYDSAKRTADLEPQVRRAMPTGEDGAFVLEDLPVLPDVPIRFPMGGGGTYAITWPIQVGDFVDVHVQTNSHGNWKRTGAASDPGDLRLHSLASTFAVPGACPNAQALDQAATMALVIEAPSILLGKDATAFVALANLCADNFNAIHTTLGSGTAPSGGGAVTFASPYTVTSVAASKTKAK